MQWGSSRAFCRRYCSKETDLQHEFSFDMKCNKNREDREQNALFNLFLLRSLLKLKTCSNDKGNRAPGFWICNTCLQHCSTLPQQDRGRKSSLLPCCKYTNLDKNYNKPCAPRVLLEIRIHAAEGTKKVLGVAFFSYITPLLLYTVHKSFVAYFTVSLFTCYRAKNEVI